MQNLRTVACSLVTLLSVGVVAACSGSGNEVPKEFLPSNAEVIIRREAGAPMPGRDAVANADPGRPAGPNDTITETTDSNSSGSGNGNGNGDAGGGGNGSKDAGGGGNGGKDAGVIRPDAGVAADAGQMPTQDKPSCNVRIASTRPAVLREFKELGLTITPSSSGTTCTMQVNGANRSVACGGNVALTGADFGAGVHEVKLLAQGPGGSTICSTRFRVPAPQACRLTDVRPTESSVREISYDSLGRMITELNNYSIPGGQQVWKLGYEGNTTKIISQVRTFLNFTGVPNTRVDVINRTYEGGVPDELGAIIDRVKYLDFDFNTDTVVDVRQTLSYDEAGRATAIDELNGVIRNRYTMEYGTRGLVKSRKLDEKMDGTTDAVAEWTYDALGALVKISSIGSQVFTMTPQYICN
jgi:hypothetical protein